MFSTSTTWPCSCYISILPFSRCNYLILLSPLVVVLLIRELVWSIHWHSGLLGNNQASSVRFMKYIHRASSLVPRRKYRLDHSRRKSLSFYYIYYRSIKDSISQYRQISCYFYLFIVVLEDHRQGKISDLSSADTQFYNYWSSTKKKLLVVETMIESLQFIVHQCFILY